MAKNNRQQININSAVEEASDRLDALNRAFEAAALSIKASGLSPDTGTEEAKLYRSKLREATEQALLNFKLRRMSESAKLEILQKELAEQKEKEKADRKAGYEKAGDLINSGAMTFPSTPRSEPNPWIVASGFPRNHRRLTLDPSGKPVVVEAETKKKKLKEIIGNEHQQENNETDSQNQEQPFDPVKWVEGNHID